MAKKVRIFFVLSALVLLLVSGITWARKQPPVPVYSYPREDYVTNYLLKPAGEYSFIGTIHSPYDTIVGYTYYDYQHDSAIPHMIANDYQGGRHFTWMDLVGPALGTHRYVDYNYRSPAGAWLGAQHVTDTTCRGGYTGLDIMRDSREVLIYHQAMWCGTDPAPRRTMIAIEPTTVGFGGFRHFDIPDSGANFGEAGMWPYGAVDTLNRVHVAMQAGETAAGRSWWGYTRCQEISGTDSILCESPGISPVRIKQDVFTSGTRKMVASVARSGTESHTVVTSPVSEKVALIWTWPTLDTNYFQTGNDVYYIESTNGGDDWLTSGFPSWPNIGTNITQFKKTDPYKAYADLAAVYDYNDNLHIFWNVHKLNTETGEFDFDDVALMHWSAATTGQLCGTPPDTFRVRYNIVSEGRWDAFPGAWNRNMAKMNAGVGVPGEPNYNWIYSSWTQFNPNDLSASGYTNGDIYISVSTNSGFTWDSARNVTNSKDPGCLPGDCDSDHWPSLAARVDSFLYLQWVNDRDAGGVPQSEGTFTNNPILYYHYPIWTPEAKAKMVWTPKNYTNPWISVPNNGSITRELRITNTGTATLNITGITTAAPWMTIGSYPATIVEGGCPIDIDITINAAGHSEEFLADSIHIQTDDGYGNNDIYLKVDVVVSDIYKSTQFVDVGNGNFVLTESNLGNIGHQNWGMCLDTLEWQEYRINPIVDGSIILGQMANGTPRVGRYIFNEPYMLSLSDVIVLNKPAVGATVIKKRYAPLNPLPPQWGNWWCWGVEEYDVIFESGATNAAERWLLMQYVKVFKYEPPLWWQTGLGCLPTLPDLYVGEAIDFDLPSDSASQNFAGFDSSLNLLYQQGYGAGKDRFFCGVALRDPNAAVQPKAYGGHIIRNDVYVYPQNGYTDDSLYSVMTHTGFAVYDTCTTPPCIADYNVVLTAGKILTHTPNLDTTQYRFVVALSTNGLQKLKDLVKMTKCGNADRDTSGAIDLGDVIKLANHLLKGGEQTWIYMSDWDGNCAVNLADVIGLAHYVLAMPGSTAPKCNCELKWP